MNPPTLHCIVSEDLYRWEVLVFEQLCQRLAAKHAVQVHTLSNFKAQVGRVDRVWLVCRNWQRAVRRIKAQRFNQNKMYLSVLGRPKNEVMPLLFWKQPQKSLPRHASFITHCAMNYRYYHEIGAIPSNQLKNLSLPSPRLKNIESPTPKQRPIVASFGPLNSENNLNFFVSSAHYLVKSQPDVLVRYYGMGPLANHLRNMIEKLGLGSHVTVVETDDLNSVQFADVFWYAPLQNDSFIPLMAAGALAKPIVCNEIAGVERYVKDTQSGFILPVHETRSFGEITLRLLSDSQLASSIGHKLKAHIDSTCGSEQLEELYRSLFFGTVSNTAFAA